MPKHYLRSDIQGLRAVAVLMVVTFHAGMPIPGGFTGVDVFFVISGYVITEKLKREWQETGKIQLANFYLNRFKRLTPALSLVIISTLIAATLFMSPFGSQQTAAHTSAGALLFASNFVVFKTSGGYFDPPAELNPLLNTWSLAVEEQFYLLLPVTLILSWSISKKFKKIIFQL